MIKIKTNKDGLKMILNMIKPYALKDPAELENLEAIWIEILIEIAKKVRAKLEEADPKGIILRRYQARAFKELLDRIDFLEVLDAGDAYGFALLHSFYKPFEVPGIIKSS